MKLSIIIPCYNVEKYIDKCIESILNQKLNDYEIILVDDSSTDNTYKKIKEYETKYPFIKTIKNKKNSGAGFSRNQGLKIASGEYISFIDSDDYIDDNYYNILMEKILKNKLDMVICDIKIIYPDGKEEVVPSCNGKIDKFNIINTGLVASPCNKIFKKSLITKYDFPEGKINEDVAVIIPTIMASEKIGYVENVYYNYIQRKNSVQNESFSNKKFDIFYTVDLALKRIDNVPNDIKDAIVFNQIILLLIYVITKDNNFFKRISILNKYRKYAKKYNISKNKYYLEFLNNQGVYHKIYYKLLVFFNKIHFNILASLLISMYHFYQKHLVKYALNENTTYDMVIKSAIKQSKLKDNNLKLSVVVPNYNYSKFLYQRIYSILNQNEKIYELIILDDCSTDDSRKIIDKLSKDLKKYINLKVCYNETNSGTAFKQWEKGYNIATGNYVWIAEADDYANKKFLKNVLKPLKENDDIMISYCDTAFMEKNGKIFMKTIKPEIDIMQTKHWDKSYINDGLDEVKNYSFLNCTIANVSSVVFKKTDLEDEFKLSGDYRQAGDWLFYVNVMLKGKVAYSNKALNFYRVHGSNVTSLTKKQAHFDEIKRVHEYIDSKIKFNKHQKNEIKKRYEFLKKVWNIKIK